MSRSSHNRDADAVQDNAEFFSFDGGESPGVSIVDVQALFLDYGKFEAKAPPFP